MELLLEAQEEIREILEKAQLGTSDYDIGVTDLCAYLLDEETVEEFKFANEEEEV